MPNKLSTRALTEGAILASIAAMLVLMSFYIPVIGTLMTFVCPVPIIIAGVRWGKEISIMATFIAALLVSILSGPLLGITVLFGFGAIGISLGLCIRRGFSPAKILIIGSIASLVGTGLMLTISFIFLKINPIAEINRAMQQGISTSLSLYEKMGLASEQLKQMRSTFDNMLKMVSLLLPSSFLFAAVFDTFLNFWVAKLVLAKLGHKIEGGLPPFSRWRISHYTVWGFIAGWLITMLSQYLGSSILYKMGANILSIFSIIFFVQALSVLSFFMKKYSLNIVFKVIIYFLLITTPFLSFIAVLVGLLDSLLDLRKLNLAKSNE